MVGKTLRNYRITEKLGVGGQGTVYKATDLKLGRSMVIKVIPPELSAKEANLKRFEREARLASSLDHPNICTISISTKSMAFTSSPCSTLKERTCGNSSRGDRWNSRPRC